MQRDYLNSNLNDVDLVFSFTKLSEGISVKDADEIESVYIEKYTSCGELYNRKAASAYGYSDKKQREKNHAAIKSLGRKWTVKECRINCGLTIESMAKKMRVSVYKYEYIEEFNHFDHPLTIYSFLKLVDVESEYFEHTYKTVLGGKDMSLTEAQKRAQKKYNEANKEARDRLRLRNATRKFIRTKATLEDIKEMEKMLNERESLLKIKELKELIDRSRRDFPRITIYDKKADVVEVFMNSIIEEEEDMDDFNTWLDSMIGRFEDNEPIIEVELGNGEPQYFKADEWNLIDEYKN